MSAPQLPGPYRGPSDCHWYGEDPAWRVPMEAAARRRFGPLLRAKLTPATLVYSLDALPVPGREPESVTVTFERWPAEHHYGLPPRDFPSVRADPGAASKHRNPDGSLCLYYPLDPPDRRWCSEMGLNVLLSLVADHLFAELFWRETGGSRRGQWVLNEAPHGVPA